MSFQIRAAALGFRSVTAVTAAVAVSRVIGAGTSDFAPGGLLYYTSMSNLLGLAWMLVALAVTIRRVARSGWRGTASVAPRTGAGIGLSLLVTMLIYLVVLAPMAFTQSSTYHPFTLTDDLVHIVVPLLVLGDWLLFARKGRLRWTDPLRWAAIPYAYVAFAMLRPLFTDAQWPRGWALPVPVLRPERPGMGRRDHRPGRADRGDRGDRIWHRGARPGHGSSPSMTSTGLHCRTSPPDLSNITIRDVGCTERAPHFSAQLAYAEDATQRGGAEPKEMHHAEDRPQHLV